MHHIEDFLELPRGAVTTNWDLGHRLQLFLDDVLNSKPPTGKKTPEVSYKGVGLKM